MRKPRWQGSSVRSHIRFSGRLHLPLAHAQHIARVLKISLQRMHTSRHDTDSAVQEYIPSRPLHPNRGGSLMYGGSKHEYCLSKEKYN